MRHAVIMAGGSGTRLWPLSRRLRPKQLLKLFDGRSLLQLARERLGTNAEHAALADSEPLFDPANIWVITSAAYIDQVAEELPDLPRANLIGEPMGRDTANAIGLAAHLLARRDADATMAVFTADHLIRPQAAFAAAIRAGLAVAEQEPESLVTFGIRPRHPATGYGYLRRGAAVALAGGPPAGARSAAVDHGGGGGTAGADGPSADVCSADADYGGGGGVAGAGGGPVTQDGPMVRGGVAGQAGPPVYAVAEFKEKPTREVAESYVRSGEYYWNSGMFAWRAAAIIDEIERNLPENARRLAEIAAEWGRIAGTAEGARRFEGLPRISIDYGVMERAGRVLVVEMDCAWHDVGSWTALAALKKADEHGNVAAAPLAMMVDAARNVAVSEAEHLILLLGVEDLVVVHSPDATLVCRRDQVERLKDLAAGRKAKFGERFE
ncbi:MAG: mannose-1-phosphate guanylyltransferase [Planctomycetota bacterium]